jgi:hypothetical protein
MSVPHGCDQDLELAVDDFDEEEIDPELRYSFQRNSKVQSSPPLPAQPTIFRSQRVCLFFYCYLVIGIVLHSANLGAPHLS